MTIIPLFPTNIHHVAVDDYADIKADLISFIDAQKAADPKGITKSNTGWHSQSLKDGPVLGTINSALIKFFNSNNYYNIQNFEVTSHWLNMNKPVILTYYTVILVLKCLVCYGFIHHQSQEISVLNLRTLLTSGKL